MIRWKDTRQKKRKYKGKVLDVALKQICDLANCTESTLEIKVRSLQQQLNSFDYGVFSVHSSSMHLMVIMMLVKTKMLRK